MAAAVEDGVGYLVKRVQQSMRRRCDAALRGTGLTMSQYAVLRALADHPQASAADLARLCFVTRQSLQDVSTGLRSAGLIDDAEVPARGRARALTLTATGRRRLSAAHTAVIAVESQMLDGLSTTESRRLSGLLKACAENLEAE
jgi:DNA-binding MarR family transcriptional regulator